MFKNKAIQALLFIGIICLSSSLVLAQKSSQNSNKNQNSTEKNSNKNSENTSANVKKKYKINFEEELITGEYEAPDMVVMNSRGLIKYKELFNKRSNFIAEVEASKGVFNEYKK